MGFRVQGLGFRASGCKVYGARNRQSTPETLRPKP